MIRTFCDHCGAIKEITILCNNCCEKERIEPQVTLEDILDKLGEIESLLERLVYPGSS